MIGIVTHAVYYEKGEIYGPADAIAKYLSEKHESYIYLKHPLWGSHRSRLLTFKEGKRQSISIGPSVAGILRYLVDTVLTIKTFWGIPRPAIIIGVDPLNCFGGVLLKLLGKCDQLVYFTADFADVRFPNPILNKIYHFFDRVCARNADYCWSVSTRIVAYRRKQGVKDENNLLIPNAPAFAKIKRQQMSKINIYQLVIVSNLQAGVAFDAIFQALKKLAAKYNNIRLVIIGGGEGEAGVRKAIEKYHVTDRVQILGRLPHEAVHKILAQSGIGIALYEDTAAWRYYSDSMKARDYMACGLPVLISGNLATVDDIVKAGAGLAIKPTTNNIIKAVEKILKDKATYKTYREHAIADAKSNDIEVILHNAMSRLSVGD